MQDSELVDESGQLLFFLKMAVLSPLHKKPLDHEVLGNYDPGLEIATDTVANATNIFSLATKNSGLVAKVATRF